MDELLSLTLRDAVYDRLSYLDTLAANADQPSKAALADTEIVRLTAAWRAVLAEHEPDARGRCPQCSRWRRPRAHPCSVWTAAHRHLITTPSEPGTSRHTPSPRRTAPAALGAS
ncbi:MAG: hypothetical protein ACRDQ5_26640 [Sciscionella sp.]